jgi:beta-lactam-binding protein with PASTA domain
VSESTCRRCSAQVPPGAEFCVKPGCGEYLAWDRRDTGAPASGRTADRASLAQSAPSPDQAGTAVLDARPARSSPAVVALPEQDANEKKLSVDAGQKITFKALIRNQSNIVDSYKLAVTGFETWWTIEPEEVYLLPFGVGEGYEQTVDVCLHPPRSPKATARSWPIDITATSQVREGQPATVATAVEIKPFDAVRLEADPKQAEGRSVARLRLVVTNESNHDLAVSVSGERKEEGWRFRFPVPSPVLIPAGEQVHGPLEMRATKPMLVGRPVDHELMLKAVAAKAQGAGKDDKKDPPLVRVAFRQRAWLPWWTALVAVALLALAAVFAKEYLDRVSVPNVIGDEISRAREELKEKHLTGVEKLAPLPSGEVPDGDGHHRRVEMAGRVFREIPEIASKRNPDSKVTLLTAVIPGLAAVPELKDLTQHAAENRLAKAGFAIDEVSPNHAPESWVVVHQEPKEGKEVQRDEQAVSVTLDKVADVPELIGQPPASAMQMLRSLDLVLVSRTPLTAQTRTELVATQTPAAKEVVSVGDEVTVTLAAPKRKPAAATSAKKAHKAKGKAKPSAAALPTLAAALPAPAAAAALAKAGLHTRQTLAISPTVPAGRLLRTEPAAGAKLRRGASVTLVVSAGFPQIAVDDGRRVLALNGVTGKPVATIAGGPVPAIEPSWSPNGREVAYVSGGRVMLIGAQGAAGPRALTAAGERFALPTFPSSSSAPAVIATVGDLANGVQAVCLLAVRHSSPSCIPEPGWTLGESISWSPAGTELLVAASRAAPSPSVVGLLELTTARPFSVRARDWRPARPAVALATPVVSGAGVLAGAFSPDGGQVALVEDLAGFNSVTLIAPSDLTLTKASRLAQLTSVCAVQWRTDGAELLVQMGEGKGAGEGACASSPGALYRVDPAKPGALSFLARGVAHPSWQPLPGVG